MLLDFFDSPLDIYLLDAIIRSMIQVAMVSMFTGKRHVMDIPLTQAEFQAGCDARQKGALIQNAFPTLSPELREFLLSGSTPEEWDAMMTDIEES